MLIKTNKWEIKLTRNNIVSTLERQTCEHCGKENCCYECDGSVADELLQSSGTPEADVRDRIFSNGFTEGVEAILLALEPQLRRVGWIPLAEAIETAMDGCDNSG